MSAMAILRRAMSKGLGEGAWQAFKGLDVTDADFQELLKSRQLGGLRRGQSFHDEITGNRYRIVRARSAVTGEGYLLKQYGGNAARIGGLTANSKKASIETNDTFVAHELAGGLTFISAGTGIGQLRTIIDNDDTAAASKITIGVKDTSYKGSQTAEDSVEALTTQPDGTSSYEAFCPWEVEQQTAVGDRVVSWALGAVTSGNWTIVLEQGYGLFRAVGSVDAITRFGALVPSATSGIAKGPTTAGMTALEASLVFGEGLSPYSGASAVWFGRNFGRFAVGVN